MKVLIDGKEYDLSPDSSGLVKITFTKQTKDAIEIGELENCSGTTLIDEIQIEQGNQATPYEDPNLILGNATGLISEIRGIEYAISDPKTGLRSQLTMLAQGFEQEVNDAIGNYSAQGQTVDGLFSEMSKVNGDINRIVHNAQGTSQLISNLNDDYQSLKSTANLYERIIGVTGDEISNNISRIIQTSDVIQTEVAKMDLATNEALTSKITQLADNINLKVSSGDLLSQINVQAGGVLITSGTNKLNITPTTTFIQDATIKSAMIESLEADKITTGTLDAAKVRVINIDADNITSNKTAFIQSNWNGISSSVRIDAGGLLSTASDGSQVYLQNGIVGVRNPQGATIGQIGYVFDGGSPTYTIRTTWGSHFGLKQVFYDNFTKGTKEKRVMYASTADDGETTVQFYANSFILHQRKINFGFAHYINGTGSNLTITGQSSISLRANESTIFVLSNNGTNNFATLHANLNMQGNTVTNTSDIRLKRDIVNDEIDSLSALMQWQHAGFNYINPDMNQDRQFSVIAQSAPDLSFTGEDGYLQVSLNKQVNMTSHALQQHVIKTNDKVEQLEAKIASLQDELALLKGD